MICSVLDLVLVLPPIYIYNYITIHSYKKITKKPNEMALFCILSNELLCINLNEC